MKKLTKDLESKIRRLNKIQLQSSLLERQIAEQLEKEGVPYNNLVGLSFGTE